MQKGGYMKGGFQQNQNQDVPISLEDAKRLKKEIDDLILKRNNLQKEIDTAITAALKDLRDEYEIKKQRLLAEHNQKIAVLELKMDDVKKDAAQNQQDRIVLDQLKIFLDDRAVTLTEKENFAANLKDEAIKLQQNTENEYKERMEDVDIKANNNVAIQNSLDKRSSELDDREFQLDEREKRLIDREGVARTLKDQSTALIAEYQQKKDEALVELKKVNEMLSSTEVLKKSLGEKIALIAEKEAKVDANLNTATELEKNNNTEKTHLSEWNKNLTEREKSVGERERLLVLHNRELDEKIKRLEELRTKGGV